MTKPSFLLSFRKMNTRRFASPLPDYAIMFNGQQVGQLSSGTDGHMGILPDHTGHFHSYPNADMTVWEGRRKSINLKAAEDVDAALQDSRRIESVHETLDPKVLRLVSGDDEKVVSVNSLYFAQRIFGSAFDVPWSFCTEIVPEPLPSISSAENIASVLMRHTKTDTDVYDFLWAISKGDRPHLDDRARDAIHDELEGLSEKPALRLLAQAMLVWLEDAYAETLNGALHRLLREIQSHNVWTSNSLSQALGYPENSVQALRVEDRIAALRDVPKTEAWKKKATQASSEDLGEMASSGLRSLLRECADMKKASPLRDVDADLVYLFLRLLHKS